MFIVPDPIKLGRPFLFLGLAAGAAALALWAKRQAGKGPRVEKLIRVEPADQPQLTVDVPWGTEVPR